MYDLNKDSFEISVVFTDLRETGIYLLLKRCKYLLLLTFLILYLFDF